MSKIDAEKKKQQIITLGAKADALIKDKNWEVMKEYISRNIATIQDILSTGMSPDIEYGIITKTVDQKYHEYVGKTAVLKDIERYLTKLIEKRAKLLNEQEDENDTEVHREPSNT